MAILNRASGGKVVKKGGGETDSLVLRTPKIFRCTHTGERARLISEWIGPRQGLGIGGGVSSGFGSFPLD